MGGRGASTTLDISDVVQSGSRPAPPADEQDETLPSMRQTSHTTRDAGSKVIPVSHVEPADDTVRERSARVIRASQSGNGTSSATGEPRQLPAQDDAVSIEDLPAVPSTRANETQLRIRVPESENPQFSQPTTTSYSDRYSYDSNYTRLAGRLQYSQTTGRWNLRYIPIDGQTDEYGGSVNLRASETLGQFKEGDFVIVQGRIVGDQAGGFSPWFDASRITPN